VPRARVKLVAKRVDLIVANDVSKPGSGFESETNEATIVTAERDETLPALPKTRLAAMILDHVESLMASRGLLARV
jgi:phosphopantothenoylcysteine synthetase/decarboxylase